MLTQTSTTAVRLLIHLESETAGKVASIKQVADDLRVSPSYLTKIARHLVRASILRAQHGKSGGVVLNRAPKDITLLAIVEACQGAILGTFCQPVGDVSTTCALHQAGAELHQSIVGVLSRWTLEDLSAHPHPVRRLRSQVHCLLAGGKPGVMIASRRKRR